MNRKFLADFGLDKQTIDSILDKNMDEIGRQKARNAILEAEAETLRVKLGTACQQLDASKKIDAEHLQERLAAETKRRESDRREFAFKTALIAAGCLDADYIVYKLGGSARFHEDNEQKELEELLKSARQNYTAMFWRERGKKPRRACFRQDKRHPAGIPTQSFRRAAYSRAAKSGQKTIYLF